MTMLLQNSTPLPASAERFRVPVVTPLRSVVEIGRMAESRALGGIDVGSTEDQRCDVPSGRRT